jgi:tetratricopeptide (TPR) repeat protein
MRDRLGHYSTLLAFVAPCLFAMTTASAAGREAEDRAARKACLTGDYTKGISILSDLFINTRDPTYIFNQGRCFEQNRRYEDAIARFEEFLRAATNQKVDEHSKTEAKSISLTARIFSPCKQPDHQHLPCRRHSQ